jgi:site-specific recombinase XerD
LDAIKRDELKRMIAEMIEKKLSRGTIKNAIAVIRCMFNQAIEAGIVQSNPVARLGRFTRAAGSSEQKGISLSPAEAERFLEAALDTCPEYHSLFSHCVARWAAQRRTGRAAVRRNQLRH